jgi:hypothetical protein
MIEYIILSVAVGLCIGAECVYRYYSTNQTIPEES